VQWQHATRSETDAANMQKKRKYRALMFHSSLRHGSSLGVQLFNPHPLMLPVLLSSSKLSASSSLPSLPHLLVLPSSKSSFLFLFLISTAFVAVISYWCWLTVVLYFDGPRLIAGSPAESSYYCTVLFRPREPLESRPISPLISNYLSRLLCCLFGKLFMFRLQ